MPVWLAADPLALWLPEAPPLPPLPPLMLAVWDGEEAIDDDEGRKAAFAKFVKRQKAG